MKENFTSVNVIIDQSGSMAHLTNDTIGGFNQFLSEQKQVEGEAVFTLCLFSTHYHVPHNFVKLAEVPNLTDKLYHPAGGTALLDAIGTTVNQVSAKINAMPEEEKPSKVIFLIITDGEENSSREFTKEQIKNLVTTHQNNNWNFVFMGANIDAISEGSSLGIASNNSMNYNASSVGTKDLYQSVSRSLQSYRSSNIKGQVDFFNQPPASTPNTASTQTDSTDPKDKS